MQYRIYFPLLAGAALIAAGALLSARAHFKASSSDRIDSTVIEQGMPSLTHGQHAMTPTFQYVDPSTGQDSTWTPSHSATWYDYPIGHSVTILVEHDGDWRSVDDFRSLYLVPAILTAIGLICGLFGWAILYVFRSQQIGPEC